MARRDGEETPDVRPVLGLAVGLRRGGEENPSCVGCHCSFSKKKDVVACSLSATDGSLGTTEDPSHGRGVDAGSSVAANGCAQPVEMETRKLYSCGKMSRGRSRHLVGATAWGTQQLPGRSEQFLRRAWDGKSAPRPRQGTCWFGPLRAHHHLQKTMRNSGPAVYRPSKSTGPFLRRRCPPG